MNDKAADSCTHLVLVVDSARHLARAPYGAVLARRIRDGRHKLDADHPFYTQLPNARGTRVAVITADAGRSTFATLTQARQALAAIGAGLPPTGLTIAVVGDAPADAIEATVEAVIAAALAADFPMPNFKSGSRRPKRLASIRIAGFRASHSYERTVAEARGNNVARWFTALPPNDLTPGRYRQRLAALARARGWRAEFFSLGRLRRLGAGAFLAVAQGSPEPDAGILHLRYAPRRSAGSPAVALVGKGICFDTGGTNLKPARYMHGMHEDMEGSAVAVGTLLALAELKVPFAVDCWLALAQNHIGPRAYKQNDVVTAANGTTIEIVHTDAEGRMVLADTLTLASRRRPALILDFATLTGACVAALSTRLSGAVSNRLELVPAIIESGMKSGERVWPFPLEKDFGESLKSDIADIKQCTLDSEADQILAASFLNRFVARNTPWIHIDLSAGNHKGGLAHIPTDITGFGVRFAVDLLTRRNLLREL